MANTNGTSYTASLQVLIYSELDIANLNTITPTAPYLLLAADNSHTTTTDFNNFVQYCNTNWQKVYFIIRNEQLLSELTEIRSISSITSNIINYVNEHNLTSLADIDMLFSIMDSFTDDIYMFSANIPNESGVISNNMIENITLRNSILLYIHSTS
jgi:hypothetical protein